jgi:predicted transglutaminase-like cysteine proteinase
MIPRRPSPQHGFPAVIAAVVLSLGFLIGPSGASVAQETSLADSDSDFAPATDRTSIRPRATFFSINQVLAKLDRERGRGPNAIRMASLPSSNTASDAPPEVKETPARGQEPFGLFTFRAPEGVLWRKWRGIETDLAKDRVLLEQCRTDVGNCPPHAGQFLRLINAVKAKSGRAQLEEVNAGVNMAIRYASDFTQHGEADRWTAPLATFATGKGDCEDFAIAKYVALSEAGFPREHLRLVLVRDRAVRQDHAVLAARLDGHWLILDSRRSALMNDSEVTSFMPLFAINHRGVQLFAAPYAKAPHLNSEVDAAPAASEGDPGKWGGREPFEGSASQLSSLPLLM